jgi:diaminobutyrate-2-oxoglutarate transaminase
MIQGLASKVPGLPNKIAATAFKRGVVMETSGAEDDVIKLLPPLTIDSELLADGLRLLEQCVAEALGVPLANISNVRTLKKAVGGGL